MTKTEGSTTSYTYGSYNRLTSAGSTTYTYDNNGNMASKNDGTDSWSYSYDYSNMMTKAVKNGATQGQYHYDGDGKRVKAIEGDTRVYLNMGFNILWKKNVTANILNKHFSTGLTTIKATPIVNDPFSAFNYSY